jgi:hypothetical protein
LSVPTGELAAPVVQSWPSHSHIGSPAMREGRMTPW